jgi:hypothetical protein
MGKHIKGHMKIINEMDSGYLHGHRGIDMRVNSKMTIERAKVHIGFHQG